MSMIEAAVGGLTRQLQEVIAADQGGSTASTPMTNAQPQPTQYTQTPGNYHHAGSYHSAGPPSQDSYYSSYYQYTGATSNTANVLMGVVTVGYALMVVAIIASCYARRPGPGVYTQFDVDPMYKSMPVAELAPEWRKAFIGKVYTLLACQIALTMVISYGMMQLGGYDLYVWTLTAGAWTRMASFIFSLVIIVSMFCYKNVYPLNLLLLLVFTVCMAYTIGMVTTAYAAAGMSMVVLEAFALTSLVFVGLTVFTMQSKIDFSYLGLILPLMLFTMIMWGFFMSFAFDSYSFHQTYALMGTIIFSLYVLYDTWCITQILSFDDYIIGAINLYLDFVNLFIFILQLLAGGRSSD